MATALRATSENHSDGESPFSTLNASTALNAANKPVGEDYRSKKAPTPHSGVTAPQASDPRVGGGDVYDLTTEAGVRSYLAGTPFSSSRPVETVSGGSANYVFRIWLDAPHEGRTTVILKHAKPYVRVSQDIAFTDERQVFEVEALRRTAAWLPKESVVQVPKIHRFDEDAHAIIMDDAGENSITLKEFMKQGGPSNSMATQLGIAIGGFLGSLHAWGTTNRADCALFEGHVEAKALGAVYYYGSLVRFFSGASGVVFFEDPPLLLDEASYETLKKVAEETKQAMVSANDHWVQGDFWPGNMLVVLDDAKQLRNIFIVDWEMSRIGIPGIEVGQFAAEIYFCGRFHEEVCKETSRLVLDNFFASYAKKFTVTEDLVRRALTHFGTHLATIGPTVGWGEKGISREVALEGARVVVDGYKADLAFLKKSPVGLLLGR